MTIKNVYEITDLNGSDVEVYEAKGGNVGLRLYLDHKTEARAILYPHVALQLNRGLSRIVNADVADPNEGGYSIANLVVRRKAILNVPEDMRSNFEADVVDIINAYIRLIERTEQLAPSGGA